MAYFIAEFVKELNGVETVETVVLQYTDALSCAQAEASVTGLSTADTLAARARCTTSAPAPPSGQIVQDRNCSGSSADQLNVIGDDSNYVRDSTTGGGGGGTPTNYDSDGDLVGYIKA